MTFSASFLRWAREEADRPWANGEYAAGLEQLAAVKIDRTTAPIDPYASDRELSDVARRRADFMVDSIATAATVISRAWLNDWLVRLEARPLAPFHDDAPESEQLQVAIRRVTCPLFWRKQVRLAAVRKREAMAQRSGAVSVRTGQTYVTDETASRYERRQASNQAILERTEIESADGEVMSLWTAVMSSVANPAIRRGELMTRIRGAEEWANARGMVGFFTTNTAPSRFHATHSKTGDPNHRHTGDESEPGAGNYGPVQPHDPRHAQDWLCRTWARARAKIKRLDLKVFGFRVAEPHHDGCPHWHMLLWVDPAQAKALQTTLRACWLQDHPEEQGADKHRFKAERIDPAKGGACAYVAKYIAKNIDDHGSVEAEGHRDYVEGETLEFEAGGNKARRVMAWASAWGIRQFQAIGQPPVTVYRELRRIEAEAIAGMSPALQAAHAAVNRGEKRRVCWRRYMEAQGGAMTGRDYQLRIDFDVEQRDGRYGPTTLPRPVGVYDVQRPGVIATSSRKAWKPRGDWTAESREVGRKGLSGWARDAHLGLWARSAQPAAQPWTRVINCTRRAGAADLLARLDARRAPIIEGPGGLLDETPWPIPPTPPAPSPTSPPSWLTRLEKLRSFRPGSATP